MSGIAGVFYLNGMTADETLIRRMTDVIQHRGPDEAGHWVHGPVGLGHRMLRTTPESLSEHQPVVSQTGELVLVADARIDNRDELITLLGFGAQRGGAASDSDLILASYQEWGEQSVEKLLGDFAFAIWDGEKQSLFCARDHFGVKPFVYHYAPGQVFAFGSEVKVFPCLPDFLAKLNELRLGHHLARTPYDQTITIYEEAFRLPPAHCMLVTPEGMRKWKYWSLNPTRELRLGSDQEYAEAFREVFTEAVRCRLRSAFPVASTLSGGLDSSAISCVARDILAAKGNGPLLTLSMVYDEITECDERTFIDSVLAQGGFEPRYTHPDQISPLVDMEKVYWHEDEAHGSPTFYLYWELCRLAQQNGSRVILDGLDGDTAVSHGNEYLVDLGRQGRWAMLADEVKAMSQVLNAPYSRLALERYILPSLTDLARRGRWISFAKGVKTVSILYELPRWNLVRDQGIKSLFPQFARSAWRALLGHKGPALPQADRIINRAFARRIGLDESVAQATWRFRNPPQTAREEHHGNITSGLVTYVFEMSDRTAAAFSMEVRHPFYDKRVVEFCLALPPEQKLQRGWTRSIMRRALADVLPSEVQWRAGKALNGAAFTHSLLHFEGCRLADAIKNIDQNLAEYINVPELRQSYDRYISTQSRTDEMRVWSAMTLALWMDQTCLPARDQDQDLAREDTALPYRELMTD